MSTENGHLDLDALADVLAGEGADSDTAHLTECAECRASLDELRAATGQVTAQLSELPAVALPTDVAARVDEALRGVSLAPSTTVTTLPRRREQRAARWLPAAAALVVLLAGAGYGISQFGGGTASDNAASGDGGAEQSAAGRELTRSSTGTDYDGRDSLARALPGLLGGTASAQQEATTSGDDRTALSAPGTAAPQADAKSTTDPLARLRDNTGLAECLLALLPPEDPDAAPLAIDYASFRGAPAMVVVLPAPQPGKLDVFVVGPACSRANDSLLFYTSVDAP